MTDGYGESDLARLRAGNITDDDRAPFARDYDRLIYSPAFRRLQGKTQVVSPGEADFFRTRLTHTIEVAQVSRRLAEDLNRRALLARAAAGKLAGWVPNDHELAQLSANEHLVDPDLCEAVAVLHDLGHPPFGHAGETALNEAVKRLTGAEGGLQEDHPDRWPGTTPSGFNGNAQSFRLAIAAIQHKHGSPGLQLTRATVDASLTRTGSTLFARSCITSSVTRSDRSWASDASRRRQRCCQSGVRRREPGDPHRPQPPVRGVHTQGQDRQAPERSRGHAAALPLELEVDDTTRMRNGLLKDLLWRYVVLDHRMATQQHGQKRVAAQRFDAYWRAARDGTPDALSLFPRARRRPYELLTFPTSGSTTSSTT